MQVALVCIKVSSASLHYDPKEIKISFFGVNMGCCY